MTANIATLIIYAYTSFAASWGPGPAIIKEFKKTCACEVKIADLGDTGGLLNRLKLEGSKTKADIVIGLDQNTLEKVFKIGSDWNSKPVEFDYGPFAFVYDSKIVTHPPKTLDDLLEPQWRGQILLEDPRLSSTGLGFLLWVIKEKGESHAWEYLLKLKPQIKLITPSWDLAYGLFKKNQGQLVFSYWTSPVYHIQEENRHDIKASPFINGNYLQKEYIMASSRPKNESLKRKFFEFMMSDFAQNLLAEKNFMYPVKKIKLPKAFDEIGTVKELPPLSPTTDQIEQWVKRWREIFS